MTAGAFPPLGVQGTFINGGQIQAHSHWPKDPIFCGSNMWQMYAARDFEGIGRKSSIKSVIHHLKNSKCLKGNSLSWLKKK